MYERGIRGGGKRRVAREDTKLGIHCLLRVITIVSILGKTWSNKDLFLFIGELFYIISLFLLPNKIRTSCQKAESLID